MTPADQIYSLPTNTGAAKLAYAMANNLTVQISHMAIGDGNGAVVNPTAAATGLVREVHRAQLNQLYQHPDNPNWLVAELVIPAEVGGWTIREIGLYDVDGDLIFVGNHAEQYKPVQSQGSDETKTVRMVILVSSLAAVTLRTDPTTVMATIKFVNDAMGSHVAAGNPHPQYALRGAVTNIATTTSLSAAQLGLVHADASAAAITATLPPSNAALGVRDAIVRRTDNTGNRLTVRAAGDDRIKFHTDKRAEGYPFFYLLGAGDYWHLRSDGSGNWWLIGRLDGTALGRPVFETTTMVSPGGWGVFAGSLFDRAEWPWLWDHAQQSGMLTTEAARAGMEGGWTSGDGVATFRGPEGRGEFLRLLDEGRGIDPARVAGSIQTATQITGDNGLEPAVHGIAQISTIGCDPGAPGSSIYYVSTAGQVINNTPQYWGYVRPRNVAYPGRIKLI